MRFIYILSLILLLLSIGCSANKDIVGIVNKNKITREEYMHELLRNYELYAKLNNYAPDLLQRQIIAEETWTRFVDGYILKDIFDSHKITVTQSEVLDTLITNIPQSILENARFQNESGDFDRDIYLSSLINDTPENLLFLRSFYQSSYIPHKKLQQKVISSRQISEKELQDFYIMKSSVIDLEIYSLGVGDIDKNNIKISEKEIENYYMQNRQSFFREPMIDFNWVIFSVAPTPKDIADSKAIADSLYKEIGRGRNFNYLARDFSAQPFARLQGMIGFMEIQELPDELITAVRNASNGEVLPPFYYDKAWWIYKIEEKTVNMVRPHVIKIEAKASRETIESCRKNMERFTELSQIIGFHRAAEELQLPMHQQRGMTLSNSIIDDVGDINNIIRRAITLPEKYIFMPILVSEEEFYIIFQIDKKTSGYFLSLFDARDEIISILRDQKAIPFLREQLSVGADSVRPPVETRLVLSITNDNTETLDPTFVRQALKLNVGQTTQVFSDDTSAYFGKVINKRKLENIPPYSQIREELKAELRSLDQDEYYSQWLRKEISKAKVKRFEVDSF